MQDRSWSSTPSGSASAIGEQQLAVIFPSVSDSMKRWHRWTPFFFLPVDIAVFGSGLFIGHKVRFGTWFFDPQIQLQAVLPMLGVFLVALLLGGAYRQSPRSMHLPEFFRIAGALCAAWVVSVALAYLVDPSDLLPRSVMVVHGLVSLVGVLGMRATARQVLESIRPAVPSPPAPTPPSASLDDLVSREATQINRPAIVNYLSDRTVLVTGAGGSVGSELSRQLMELGPFRLGLVDVSEYNLYRLEKDLRQRSFDGDVEFCIGDVRDAAVMNRLFEDLQPDIVLHTAAYKHVPLMERHPAEAFRNNTMATVHLLRLCERHDAEQFVFVSTDKAVEPTSVLGATKRLAEWYVQAATSSVHRKIVRFGNVFGSQGSVVPLFEEQLADGGPVTVTHPEMERYFMTVDEACGLILQTILFDSAPVYCLQMGEPIDIVEIARTLVERWYPGVDPDRMIEFVGRRPGEKLSEQLVMPHEQVHPTEHESILGLRGPVPYSRDELEMYFHHLKDLTQQAGGSRASLRRALSATDLQAISNEISSLDR